MGIKPTTKLFLSMLFLDFCYCFNMNSSMSDSISEWTMLTGLVVIVFLAMLSIIAGLLWKIYKLSTEKEKRITTGKSKTKKCKKQIPPDSTPACPQNDVELGKLLPPESVCLETDFRMNKSLIENLKTIEKCKLSILRKGQLRLENPGNEKEKLDVMVRSVLDPTDTAQQELIKFELQILSEIEGHPNILPLIGFTEDQGVVSIITEYPDGGNLQDYLRGFRGGSGVLRFLSSGQMFRNRLALNRIKYNVNKSELDSKLGTLSTFDILSFAYQIAKGMRHMANNSYYHRQLSLHNIFITSNKTIRIGNFSLTRSRENNEYYKGKTTYEFSQTHMAPEAVDERRFTERADVWSYGVCLWELFTLGKTPYEGETDISKFVNGGGRLSMPDTCHPEVYVFMRKCWNKDSFCRPTFVDCLQFFEQHFQKFSIRIMNQVKEKLEVASEYQASLDEWRNGEEDIDC